LRGEVGFRLEQKSAKVRKQGEGECNKCSFFHPHPEFLVLVPRAEIQPSPLKGEGPRKLVLTEVRGKNDKEKFIQKHSF